VRGRKYAIDIDEDRFLDLLDSESHVSDHAAFQAGQKTLCDKLKPLPGVWDVDYNGHSGAAIYMTIDDDVDSQDLRDRIAATIEEHLDWCSGLDKQEHVVERRKASA